MSSNTSFEEAFAVPIEGTSFIGFIDENDRKRHVRVDGHENQSRSRDVFLLVGDKLRKEGYKVDSVGPKPWENKYSMEFAVSYIGDDTRINPLNTALEVKLILDEMKKLAEMKGAYTGDTLGYKEALSALQYPLDYVELQHTPDARNASATQKILLPVNTLRTAIGNGLVSAYADQHVEGGAAKVKAISDSIIDTLASAQTEKTRASGKWGNGAKLSTREVRLAIQSGLEEGLKEAGVEESKRGGMIETIMKEIYREIAQKSEPSRAG